MEKRFCFRYDEDNKKLIDTCDNFLIHFFQFIEDTKDVVVEDRKYFEALFNYMRTFEFGSDILLDKKDADCFIGIIDTLASSVTNDEPPYTEMEMRILGIAQRIVGEYKECYGSDSLALH